MNIPSYEEVEIIKKSAVICAFCASLEHDEDATAGSYARFYVMHKK